MRRRFLCYILTALALAAFSASPALCQEQTPSPSERTAPPPLSAERAGKKGFVLPQGFSQDEGGFGEQALISYAAAKIRIEDLETQSLPEIETAGNIYQQNIVMEKINRQIADIIESMPGLDMALYRKIHFAAQDDPALSDRIEQIASDFRQNPDKLLLIEPAASTEGTAGKTSPGQ